MKALCATLLFVCCAFSPAAAKKRHCMLRLHAEANARDSAAFASSVRARLSGKEVAIEKIARISEQDVVACTPYSLGNGSFGALFELNEHGRLTLDSLSVERRGGFVFIFINGRPITEMQIDKRVSDGRIYIASGLTAADIELMRKDWPPSRQRRR